MTGLTGLNTQQVGSCGELFVQYKLLKLGIESAPMTTDYGIDLVALDPKVILNPGQIFEVFPTLPWCRTPGARCPERTPRR